jgi:hypothetical protein
MKLPVFPGSCSPAGLVAIVSAQEVINANTFRNDLLEDLTSQHVAYTVRCTPWIVAFLKLKHAFAIAKSKLDGGNFAI